MVDEAGRLTLTSRLKNEATLRDLGKLAVTVGLGGVAALTPRAARTALATAVAKAGSRLRRAEIDAMAERLADMLPDKSPDQRHRIAVEMRTVRIEQALCRGYGVFRRGWPARVQVTGAEHLHAAHAEGRGAIVWLMTFLDATPFNVAAAAEGYPVTHLSIYRHGIGASGQLSVRLVAPIILRGEKRSQGRRVVIPATGGFGYMRELRSTIEDDHGTVTIRGETTYGRRMIEAPYLGAVARFPTGAPSLAHRSGAPLLTAAIIRHGPLFHEVLIDEPISVSRNLDRRTFQYEAVQEFAQRLDRRARDHPGSLPWLAMRDRHRGDQVG